MHEMSVVANILEIVMEEAKKRHAKQVKKVTLHVGKLTFLAHEQLRFAFRLMSEGTLAHGAELEIVEIAPMVECECGYAGEMMVYEDEIYHFVAPVLQCPKCGSRVRITQGRDCFIRDIVMEV